MTEKIDALALADKTPPYVFPFPSIDRDNLMDYTDNQLFHFVQNMKGFLGYTRWFWVFLEDADNKTLRTYAAWLCSAFVNPAVALATFMPVA
jgi:hypothetical protein